MSGFQKQVNLTPALAVAGDFASANPRASVLAGEGGLIAGEGGVVVGKFAWVDPADQKTVNSYGLATAAPDGFVHREQQALITTYLAESGNVIPEGLPVVLHNEGDFWALLAGSTSAIPGDPIYADYSTGDVVADASPTGASVTAVLGSTNTAALGATFTATGSGTNLTTSAQTGVISIGDTVAGVGIPANTTIVSQTSGTTGAAGVYVTSQATTIAAATGTAFGETVVVSATTGLISIGDTISGGAGFPVGATVEAQVSGTEGGAGTYTLSAPGTAYTASATGVTTFGNVLKVTAIGSGTLSVGEAISGTGIPTGAVIDSQVSGTAGGIGVYTISPAATAYAASTTVTVVAGVLTSWKAKSVAAVGELVKISTWG
jgi:hypothetical protein